MNIKEKLAALEKIARQLDPDPKERKAWRDAVNEYSDDFLDHIEDIKAYVLTEDKGKALYDLKIGAAKPIETLLSSLKYNVDRPGLNPASGGHLAYIPGGGLFPSALGDYLADVFNRYAGVFYGSPGAVRMENQLIKWLAEMMGFPETAAGNLSSGGSIANQIAIGAARDAKKLKAIDFHRSVIYTTRQVHHCVYKSINMVGLREAIIRSIPMDEQFRMNTQALDTQIKADQKAGLNPFLVIASAGTTDVGAIDPLDQIANICTQNDLWFHVDAAYGGFFIMLEETKALFKGIERADSLVVDPHKGLFLPYGTGALLVRNGQQLFESQHMEAGYLQDAYLETEEVSPADLSPELTKHFRGLRFWLPLQLYGVERFKAALAEKLWLTRYFYEEIKKVEGFEVGPYPQLSVMTYRYVPKKGDANQFNAALIEEVKKDGRVFLSSTLIDGIFYLRLAVLSFRTHRSTIDTCIAILKEKVAYLEKQTQKTS